VELSLLPAPGAAGATGIATPDGQLIGDPFQKPVCWARSAA